MATMSELERRDFWEITEDRCQTRSMILTSQLPLSCWHEQIGDPTLADGDNAHRIEMRGESMRKQRGEKRENEHRSAGQKLWKRRAKNAPRRSDFHFPTAPTTNSYLTIVINFLQNPTARVASLRQLITAIPER
jgi:hypothetical protein